MHRVYFRNVRALALAAALGAAALLAHAPAGAQGNDDRGYRRGDRLQAPQSGRVQSSPAPAPSGGGDKWRRGEGRGGRGNGDWSGGSRGGDDHRYDDGRRYRGHDHGWRDGGRHYAPPRPRYWHRPRYSVRIGIGLPYYYPYWSHRHHIVRRPIVREYVPQIEVDNEPPAGCYYWDPYCERDWVTLDEYTEHLDGADHGGTIDVLDESTGRWVRTLVFDDGYWSVRR